MKHAFAIACVCALASGCAQTSPSSSTPTAAAAKAFLDTANATTLKLGIQAGQAGWVQQTFITDDTEAIAARANQAAIEAGARFAQGSGAVRRGAGARRRAAAAQPAQGRRSCWRRPSDPKESDELTKIMARLESTYGKGKWCADPSKPDACQNIDEVTRILATLARREDAARRLGGLAHHLAADAQGLRSASSSCRTRARRSSASPTPARCGAASTT